jgi:hypothetical protein
VRFTSGRWCTILIGYVGRQVRIEDLLEDRDLHGKRTRVWIMAVLKHGANWCEERLSLRGGKTGYSRSAPYLSRMSLLEIASGTPVGMCTLVPHRMKTSYASKMA